MAVKMLVIALVLGAAGGQKGSDVRESLWAGGGGLLMGKRMELGMGTHMAMPGRRFRMRKTSGSLS